MPATGHVVVRRVVGSLERVVDGLEVAFAVEVGDAALEDTLWRTLDEEREGAGGVGLLNDDEGGLGGAVERLGYEEEGF